jgi:hypothetical protein
VTNALVVGAMPDEGEGRGDAARDYPWGRLFKSSIAQSTSSISQAWIRARVTWFFVKINSGDAIAADCLPASQDEQRVKVELVDLGIIETKMTGAIRTEK